MQSTSEKIFRSSHPARAELVVAEDQGAPVNSPVTALVVDSSPSRGWPLVKTLSESGFRVTIADTFAQAKARLIEAPPALLLTDVRLREYNGLQLVLRGKTRCPTMGAIVLSSVGDSVLQKEAEVMGATFVVQPIDSRDLIALAFRTLLRDAPSDVVDPIRPPFERRTHERRYLSSDDLLERRRGDRRRNRGSLIAVVARRD